MRLPAWACVIVLSGCLPAFDPGPAGSSAGGATGGNGGTTNGGGGKGGGIDGGGGGVSDMGTPPAGDLGTMSAGDLGGGAAGDMALACDQPQSTATLSSPSGHHHPGDECQGCHAGGGGAPTFTLGGTLYNAATGGVAVAGATINVTDATGKKVKIVSADDGNFWTTTALAFPIKVDASLCPATVPMSATVGGNGACNNCHNSTFRVHVP